MQNDDVTTAFAALNLQKNYKSMKSQTSHNNEKRENHGKLSGKKNMKCFYYGRNNEPKEQEVKESVTTSEKNGKQGGGPIQDKIDTGPTLRVPRFGTFGLRGHSRNTLNCRRRGNLGSNPGVQEKLGILNGGVVYAVYSYENHNLDELSFKEGEKLVVLRKGDECEREWWWSRLDDREGYIPRNLLGLYPRVHPPQKPE
uniref:SH3 domain-containing protein n=1 Tax=Timema cristinae TaxID=61476 RepID=A0A7R9H0X4_TIMCR|nr:unnamed protein product [Timema cristinae]